MANLAFKRLPLPALALGPLAAIAALVLSACGGSKSSLPRGVAWPAPPLQHPKVIKLTPSDMHLNLDPGRDYRLQLPRGKPLTVQQGLTVNGGRNVVLTGGTLNVTGKSGAMVLQNQTGTVHVEGVRFTGPSLVEGIDLGEAKGATVQLENIYISTVHGTRQSNHADLMQSWAGPKRLLVDGFVGSTDYQGFFLLPNQHYAGPPPKIVDLRNVYIDARKGGYALWRSSKPGFPLHVQNVFVSPNPNKPKRDLWLMPSPTSGDRSWQGVRTGTPRAVVSKVQSAGAGY